MKRAENTEVTAKRKRERRLIPQEAPERAPTGWAEVQKPLAEEAGISLLLVEGHQPPALVVSTINSICPALQSPPHHVKRVVLFCGAARARARAAQAITHY